MARSQRGVKKARATRDRHGYGVAEYTEYHREVRRRLRRGGSAAGALNRWGTRMTPGTATELNYSRRQL